MLNWAIVNRFTAQNIIILHIDIKKDEISFVFCLLSGCIPLFFYGKGLAGEHLAESLRKDCLVS